MWLVAKLLFGKAFTFFKNNWIWLIPILFFVGAYFYANKKIDDAYTEGHSVGVVEEKQRWELRVKVENETNRKIETIIKNSFNNFSTTQEKQSRERIARENKQTDIIKEYILSNPVYQDCKVDNVVLEARNKIRQEGPK